jgi:hypothetical protein
MQQLSYTPGEVAYLLSLSRSQARDESVRWSDSVGSLSHDDLPATTSTEFAPVLLIARWRDVHGARATVVARKRAEAARELDAAAREAVEQGLAETWAIVAARLAASPERAIAAALGLSDTTVHRRFRASLEEILAELGGSAVPETPASSRVSACLVCAERPRARSADDDRQLSTCVECYVPPAPTRRHAAGPVHVRSLVTA